MTRQQYIKGGLQARKVLSIFLGVIELVTLAGLFLADYTTRHRMGMQRHVFYLNSKWERTYPVDILRILGLGLLVLMALLLVYSYIRRRQGGFLFFLSFLINLASLGFILFFDTGRNRAYYIISLCLLLVTILQNMIYALNIRN